MVGKVRVLNTKDRYYNWAYKWNILEIDENSLEQYLNAWFVLVWEKEIEIKNNIIEDDRSIQELKDILDHNGIKYKTKAKKSELLLLVKKLEEKKEEEKEENLEEIKNQIIFENIETKENILKMSDNDILEIAKNNGLI